VTTINGEPDGNFPKGRPDPYIPENRAELCKLVSSTEADLGITWDADADRVFFVTEKGDFVDPYYLNTLLIKNMLGKFPGASIVYEPRYQWATLETITQFGGVPIECQVGHSYIKQKSKEVDAVLGGEGSGHIFYRHGYYDYDDAQNNCLSDCQCGDNQCGSPRIYDNDPRCTECQTDEDCNDLDRDYCNGEIFGYIAKRRSASHNEALRNTEK